MMRCRFLAVSHLHLQDNILDSPEGNVNLKIGKCERRESMIRRVGALLMYCFSSAHVDMNSIKSGIAPENIVNYSNEFRILAYFLAVCERASLERSFCQSVLKWLARRCRRARQMRVTAFYRTVSLDTPTCCLHGSLLTRRNSDR